MILAIQNDRSKKQMHYCISRGKFYPLNYNCVIWSCTV